MASGREDGRNDRILSTRELTDITESLRWKADQDLDAVKRLKGAGGMVGERWEGLERTLREQAKRKHELAEQLEQEDTALILRELPSERGEQE